MSKQFTFDPKLDFAIERFIDAPTRLVWEALTKPEHLKEWYMPKSWGRVSRTEMDVRPGGIFSIDIATADGHEVPNLGCFLDAIPITAIMTMEPVGTGTRYVFTALHRDEADLEKHKASGFYQGTEIAVDQFVEHVIAMKSFWATRGGRVRHEHRGLDNKGCALPVERPSGANSASDAHGRSAR